MDAVPLWALCLLALAAAARHPGKAHGGHSGAAAHGDSGRSLLEASEQADDDAGLLEVAVDGTARGMEAGLAPWTAQTHLAVQQEYRRLSLPMLACRSRFIVALREAGPDAQHVADAALQAGRDLLDRAAEAALADVPLASTETDSELVAIHASLAAGARYPAGDILEARWRRAVRLSRTPEDGVVAEARARVGNSARPLCRVIGQQLKAGLASAARPLPAEVKATVAKLWTCLQHRLLPGRGNNGPK